MASSEVWLYRWLYGRVCGAPLLYRSPRAAIGTDRLAELAADRGDLEELRRLVDEGNEKAADRAR